MALRLLLNAPSRSILQRYLQNQIMFSSFSAVVRGSVLAISLAAASLAMAAPVADVVSKQDVMRVEQEWGENQTQALASLAQLKAQLETDGKADQQSTVSNVYWLAARGAYASTQDCEGAYDALYRATVLGFQKHWPTRGSAYATLSTHLNNCLTVERRTALASAAATALNTSALQGLVNRGLAEEAGMLRNPKDKVGLKSMERVVQSAKVNIESVLGIMIPIVSGIGMLVLIMTIYRGAYGGGGSSSTPSSTPTQTASPTAADSTDHTKNAPVRDKRPTQKNHARKGRSVMQRLTPWR